MTECLKKFFSLSLNNIMFRASLDVSSKNMSKSSEYFALPWCLVCLLHNPFFASLFKARTRLGTYVYNEVLSLQTA